MLPVEDTQRIAPEFLSVLSSMAYDHGHSAGEAEVDMLLHSYITELLPAVQAFEARIRKEAGCVCK